MENVLGNLGELLPALPTEVAEAAPVVEVPIEGQNAAEPIDKEGQEVVIAEPSGVVESQADLTPPYDPTAELDLLLGKSKVPDAQTKFKDLTEVFGKELKDEAELVHEVKALKNSYEEKIKVLESSRINDLETIKELAKLESYDPNTISDDAYIRSQFPKTPEGETKFQEYKDGVPTATFEFEAKKLRDQEHYFKNAEIQKLHGAELERKQVIDTRLKTTLSTMTKAFDLDVTQSERDSVYNSLKMGIAGKHIRPDGSIDIDRAVLEQVALIKLPHILKAASETLEREKKASFVQGKKEIIKTASNVSMNRSEQPPRQNPVEQDSKKGLVDALDQLFLNTHGN